MIPDKSGTLRGDRRTCGVVISRTLRPASQEALLDSRPSYSTEVPMRRIGLAGVRALSLTFAPLVGCTENRKSTEQKSEAAIEHLTVVMGVVDSSGGSAAAPSLGAMVMGKRSGIETALIFLVGLSGLAILWVVLFSGWIERFADLMAQRSERRREKALTEPTLDG
jgi:hypothetical protein